MNENNNLLYRYELAVAAYLHDQEAVGASKRTLDNYRRRLRFFLDHLETCLGETQEDFITPNMVRTWRDDMLATGKKPTTVKQYMVEIKAFLNATMDPAMGYPQLIEGGRENPVSERLMPRVKADQRKPYAHVLSAEDYKKLWENVRPDGKHQTTSTWARNYAIAVLFLDSKIRNEEMLNLKLSDINFRRKRLHVRSGKGDKPRTVPITDISVTAIQIYLKSGIRPDYCTDEDYLFGVEGETGTFGKGGCTFSGGVWHQGSTEWLSTLCERHVKNVTGKTGFRTHSLRHAGSALDLNCGKGIEYIQAALGHSSIMTTQIYTGKLDLDAEDGEIDDIIESRDQWAKVNQEVLDGIVTSIKRGKNGEILIVRETVEKTA